MTKILKRRKSELKSAYYFVRHTALNFLFRSEIEENENVKLYIRRLDHSPKSTHIGFDDQLYVSHLENSRLIYLQSEWMSQRRMDMEQSIAEQVPLVSC